MQVARGAAFQDHREHFNALLLMDYCTILGRLANSNTGNCMWTAPRDDAGTTIQDSRREHRVYVFAGMPCVRLFNLSKRMEDDLKRSFSSNCGVRRRVDKAGRLMGVCDVTNRATTIFDYLVW